MERIPAVPLAVREKLVDYLYPIPDDVSEQERKGIEDGRERVKADAGNRDCLMRVYLGKKERRHTRKLQNVQISLRNLQCDATMLLDLMGKEQVDKLNRMLARSLAAMNFQAGCDAKDVEFVLGGLPTIGVFETETPGLTAEERQAEGNMFEIFDEKVCLWLLDFNQVNGRSNLTDPAATAKHLERCVEAYWGNDPYYPRPSQEQLWKPFREEYLQAVARNDCLNDQTDAVRYINAVEAEDGRRREERKARERQAREYHGCGLKDAKSTVIVKPRTSEDEEATTPWKIWPNGRA